MSASKKTKQKNADAVRVSENQGIESQPISRVEWVHRDTLQANDYNPNAVACIEMDLLAQSIFEDGWTQPIVAFEDGTIIDGFHRFTVSERSKIFAMTEGLVPVVYLNKERGDRMLSTIRHNRASGVHGVKPMASIVRELIEHGYTREELQTRLGMEDEEIDRLWDSAGMPEQIGRAKVGFNAGWVPKGE